MAKQTGYNYPELFYRTLLHFTEKGVEVNDAGYEKRQCRLLSLLYLQSTAHFPASDCKNVTTGGVPGGGV